MQDGIDVGQVLTGIFRMADTFLPQKETNSFPYDLLENDTFIKIYIEIPGISPKTLSVDFFNNKMKIIGEKVPYLQEDFNIKTQNIRQDDIDLNIILPLAITDRKNVKVNIANGILCITINKEAEFDNKFSMKIED
jgi:HSP20 family molecular chaperone IbpA